MSQTPGPSGGGGSNSGEPPPPADITLAKLFHTLGLFAWFSGDVTQHFGQNGEAGEDFGVHANTPIGSATAGKVVAVWQDPTGSSVGTIVQVQAPDGSLWHYQHMRTSSVGVGQRVYPGTVIGLSGGCPTGGYSSDPSQCNFRDQFSTNPHIEVRYAPKYDPHGGIWNQHWINPAGVFAALPNTTVGQTPPGGNNGSSSGGGSGENRSSSSPGSSSGCAHSITFPAPPLSGEQPTVVCLDPAIDFAARAALLLVALVLLVMAIYLFTHQGATVQGAGQQAQSKVAGVAKLATLAV